MVNSVRGQEQQSHRDNYSHRSKKTPNEVIVSSQPAAVNKDTNILEEEHKQTTSISVDTITVLNVKQF